MIFCTLPRAEVVAAAELAPFQLPLPGPLVDELPRDALGKVVRAESATRTGRGAFVLRLR